MRSKLLSRGLAGTLAAREAVMTQTGAIDPGERTVAGTISKTPVVGATSKITGASMTAAPVSTQQVPVPATAVLPLLRWYGNLMQRSPAAAPRGTLTVAKDIWTKFNATKSVTTKLASEPRWKPTYVSTSLKQTMRDWWRVVAPESQA